MNKTKIFLFLGFFLIIFQLRAQEERERNFISSKDDKFYYTGRIDFSNPDFARFDWPATGFNFQFKGKWVKLHINGGDRNYFNLYVNGELSQIFHSKNDTVIKVMGSRSETTMVRLFKRTEGDMGQTLFYGVELSPGASLLPFSKLKTRKIEFIGNSITAGYGTEGKNKLEKFEPLTENVWKSYASIIARSFGAEANILAHSGLGVVRNYGDESLISTEVATMPQRYNQTLDTDNKTIWNFSLWTPDAVVINLGTNDFSTSPYPKKFVFQDAYENLVKDIWSRYKDVPVFCITGPMGDEPAYSYIKETVEKLRVLNSNKKIYFIGVPTALLDENEDLGSDYHPSFQGQKKIARHITPVIGTVLKWNYTLPNVYNKL